MKPKIFSFFAGSGFLDLGFESEDFSVAYVNEFNPAFVEAYKHSRLKLDCESPRYGYHVASITDYRKPELDRALRARLREARNQDCLVGFVGGPLT